MLNGSYLALASEALRALAVEVCADARAAIARSLALREAALDARQRMHAALAERQHWQDHRAHSGAP